MASYIAKLLNLFWAAPPEAPDGKTDEQAAGHLKLSKTTILHDLAHLNTDEMANVLKAIKTIASGEPMDDKELMLEHSLAMLQGLPANSTLGGKASDAIINMLWKDLPHPAGTTAGPGARYRKHDGSGNNPWNPDLGKAGSPYCRNVPPMKTKGPNLPDPELVFEHLLKRKGPFRPHPSGLNRLFFSFATVVIHECFQTSRKDPWINETSSYADLSTLYGNTEKEQKRVRTYKNGLLHPDTIASERIMMMPPGVVAVVILLSRNHNHIAESLLSLNEEGNYDDWNKLDDKKKQWQDEDIFQLSRNINVGFFATVVLRDYVAAILNTPRANSEFSLALGAPVKVSGTSVERGTGNVCSVEFAVLYHWHAALSAADAKWMEDLIRWNLQDFESMDKLTPDDFWKTWTFDKLKRGADGRFSDEDLGKIIKDCIEEPAHAFGAHGTPSSLRVVEILSHIQAREVYNVCTLSEFRKYLSLKPYESFEEWAEDKETAHAARMLYGHIDNLELYPGLQAECTKPPVPGSGVCPSQTTGRGILDDAVALVRGDRFLTVDFNSSTLTNWGVNKLSETAGGSYGGILPKLLFETLPGEFTGTSPYALLPFYTPEAAKGILKGNKAIDQYDLKRPASGSSIVAIHTQEACKKVFLDRENFRTIYDPMIRNMNKGHGFIVGWDDQKRHDERKTLLHNVFYDQDFDKKLTAFFREHYAKAIKKSSLHYADNRRSLDIVRDVINVVAVQWAADRFAIPVKSHEQPRGLISLGQLFDMIIVTFIYQSFNVLPVNEWLLREASLKVAPLLRSVFETHLKSQQGGGKEAVVDWLAKGSAFEVGPEADRLYHALHKSNLLVDVLATDCMGIIAPVVGTLTQQVSLLTDLYLSDGYEKYKNRIVELVDQDTDAAYRELLGFAYEGIRHAFIIPGMPRMAAKDITVQDGARGPVHIKAHQTILIGISKCAMDPVAFPNPEQIDPTRPLSSYTIFGHGMHLCFGQKVAEPALVASLREIFRLKKLRRAPGRAGRFSIREHEVAGIKFRLYLDQNSKESSTPTTLQVIYEE